MTASELRRFMRLTRRIPAAPAAAKMRRNAKDLIRSFRGRKTSAEEKLVFERGARAALETLETASPAFLELFVHERWSNEKQ